MTEGDIILVLFFNLQISANNEWVISMTYIDALVQDYGISIALALEISLTHTKPSIWHW